MTEAEVFIIESPSLDDEKDKTYEGLFLSQNSTFFACMISLCEECGTTGLCFTCAELWESEIDLEDMEAEEVFQCSLTASYHNLYSFPYLII